MKRSRFTEEQIAYVLCGSHGLSDGSDASRPSAALQQGFSIDVSLSNAFGARELVVCLVQVFESLAANRLGSTQIRYIP